MGSVKASLFGNCIGWALCCLACTSVVGQDDKPLTSFPPLEQLKPEGTFEKQVLTRQFFCEGASYADFDRDGQTDVVAGPYVYRGPLFEDRYAIYPVEEFQPAGYSHNFLTFTHDFNNDGHVDVMRVGFPGAETVWYQNPGPEALKQPTEPWKMHVIFDITDNESPGLWQLVGDESPELVFQTDGYFGFATPDPNDPYAKWTFHKVSEQIAGGRFTHGIGVGDVNGDGRVDFLTPGGWLEQPADWKQAGLWKYHQVAFGPAPSQMYAYDFDGDGLNDILCAVHAHQWGLVWHRQIRDGDKVDFELNWIVGATPDQTDHQVVFTQAHAVELVDMNGDGLKDVITGKRYWAHGGNDPGGNDPAVLYWFETQRSDTGVRFVPHLIDQDSGVGTQVTVGDVDRDGKPDVVVGNKKGAFVFTQK